MKGIKNPHIYKITRTCCMKFCYIEDWRTYWNIMETGQAVHYQSLTVCPMCLADSLSHLCESDVVPVVFAALLQHVSRPRQPLEDAGSLSHRHLLYPLMQHHKHVTFWYELPERLDLVSTGCRSFSRLFKVFFLTRIVWQPWISPTSGTTPCWSCRWAGPSPGGWWTSLTRSTSSSRWSRRSRRDNGGGGASRWVCLRVRLERGWGQEAETGELILWLWWLSGDPQLDRPPAQREEQPGAGDQNLRDDQQVTCTFFFL